MGVARLLCVAAVAMAAWAALAAGDVTAASVAPGAASQAASAPEPLAEALIRECKIHEPAAGKLRAKQAEMDKALADWDATSGEKLAAVQTQLDKARASGDVETILKLVDQKEAIRKEREAIVRKYTDEMMAMLTEDQKIAWEAYQYYLSISPTYAPAKLTDDQVARIRELCLAAFRKIHAENADAAAVAMIKMDLLASIDAVLTPQQLALVHPPSSAPAYVPPPPPTPAPKPVSSGGTAKKNNPTNNTPTGTNSPPRPFQPGKGGGKKGKAGGGG